MNQVRNYEVGSVIDLGLQTCRDLDDKWFQEGVDAAKVGMPVTICWNSMQQAGHAYGLMLVNMEADYKLWWSGDYADVLPAEMREDYIGD